MSVIPPRSVARYGATCTMCDATATRTCSKCGKLGCGRHVVVSRSGARRAICRRCQMIQAAWKTAAAVVVAILFFSLLIYLDDRI